MNGKVFKIIKFRSMIFNAESKTGPIWAEKEDKRITFIWKIIKKVCHIVRRPERPYFINIIKGECQ